MVVNHEAENIHLDPTALRKAKIVYNFGLSECNRVKVRTILEVQKSRSLDGFGFTACSNVLSIPVILSH